MDNEFNKIDDIAYKLFCEDYNKMYGDSSSALSLNNFIISRTSFYYNEAEKYLRREKIIKLKNVKNK